tara:strand:+ start:178 stop:672 length:495 start_codon:yes stop_codon:yes gene_type:complete
VYFGTAYNIENNRTENRTYFWLCMALISLDLKKFYGTILEDYISRGLISENRTKWISQATLYEKIKSHFPNEIVLEEGTPEFLDGQRYDIWFPERSITIEYNGIQHYEPVKFFGGVEGFKETVRMDKLKRERSERNGVELIIIKEGYSLKGVISQIENLIKLSN